MTRPRLLHIAALHVRTDTTVAHALSNRARFRIRGRCAKLKLIGRATPPATPPLPAERLSVATLPPNNPHRVYVLDDAFENEIDARVHLFDGDTYQRLGQIDAGFNPGFNLSPDGKTSIVGTTYFSRGSRGVRTEVVEFPDNSNLKTAHNMG